MSTSAWVSPANMVVRQDRVTDGERQAGPAWPLTTGRSPPLTWDSALACMLRETKVQPTAYGADQRQRNEPDKFQVTHLGGLEPGMPMPPP